MISAQMQATGLNDTKNVCAGMSRHVAVAARALYLEETVPAAQLAQLAS